MHDIEKEIRSHAGHLITAENDRTAVLRPQLLYVLAKCIKTLEEINCHAEDREDFRGTDALAWLYQELGIR
jgi:hypothetical protein